MAEVREAVQRLKVEGSESGLDQVDSKLRKLGGAQKELGDRFSESMQKQQQFSASTDRSFAQLLPVFDAAKVAAVAAIGAIGAAVLAVIKAVSDSNDALDKMTLSAKRAGLSLEDFNRLQEVAKKGKISEENFATGAESLAKNLNNARYAQNEMGRLLDANNVKFKRGNDLLIDTNKLFDIARDLIRRAGTEQDKIKIAEMLGLTKEWVPVLDKTRQEFVKMQYEVSALGLKIDSDAIKLAKKFEEEWNQAGDVFTTFIKSSIQGLLPEIDRLIKKAKEFAGEFTKDRLVYGGGGSGDQGPPVSTDDLRLIPGSRSIRESKENLEGLALAITAVGQAWDEIMKGNFNSGVERLNAGVKLWTNQTDENTKALIRQGEALRVVEGLMREFDEAVSASVKSAEKGGWPKFFEDQAKMLDAASKMWVEGGRSKIPIRPGAFQNLDENLEQRMEMMQMEIEGTRRGAEAITSLRIAYELERAAKKDGIAIDRQKIQARADEYAATERLRNEARLLNDARFERDQLGRTDTEAAVAQRLRGAGLDVNLDSSVAQMIRLNEQLKTAKDLSSEFALSFVRDIRNGVNALTALQNALNKVLDLLIEMAVKAAVAKSVGAASGFDFGSLFGAGKYGGGGVGDQGPTLAMVAHSGGIAGMGGGQRYVHPAYFENAPRYHMGVDEVPAILQRGEEVIPRGGRSSRAPVINLNITNNAGADVQSGEARQNQDGGIDIDVLIERKVNKTIANGAADAALSRRHGVGPQVTRR